MLKPAAAMAFGIALPGVVVNHSGVCCASAKAKILAKGLMPIASARSLLINTTAEAPSLIFDALAAVMVLFSNAGANDGTLSNFTFV